MAEVVPGYVPRMATKTEKPMNPVSREQIEEIDLRAQKEFGIPADVLMEAAGKRVAEEVLETTSGPVLVLTGKGNNGGDGFVAARYLWEAGREVRIHPLSPPTPGTPPARNLARVQNLCGPLSEGVIVDAIFGTGLRRDVEGKYREMIEEINRRKTTVISIDIPSGLDANTGEPLGAAVKADVTITMGLPKTGLDRGAKFTGKVIVADIGYPAELIEQYQG
jgi:hydroxyethylthiazole kinase-like uncharacterized protein yjeF